LEGTVKAFMPARSGRRVAGDGFARGLGLLLVTMFVFGLRSVGLRNAGASCECADTVDLCDAGEY